MTIKAPQLPYHEFPRCIAHADEIHALRQTRHINLLGFSVEAARLDGLTHEIGDTEFICHW